MKRWALFCGIMLLVAGAASAQDASKFEAFGGYSYLRSNALGIGENFNGGSGSVAYNLNPWLGVVGDFGGYHWSQSDIDANVVTYLFGPKVSVPVGKFTPFAQVLFGGGHVSGSALNECDTARVHREEPCSISGSENAFAMTLGGGVDWFVTPHIGIRLIQAEYLLSKFNDGENNRQNNARISAGVVLRF